MIVPVPLPVVLGVVIGGLLGTAGLSYVSYNHGKFVEHSEQVGRENAILAKLVQDEKINAQKAFEAGKKFEDDKQETPGQVLWRTREIHIPPDADPFMPVWFVRMFDRLASESNVADPYPGLADGAPSDVRLSEVKSVLERWVVKYENADKQIGAIRQLNPVLPTPEDKKKTVFQELNPFD